MFSRAPLWLSTGLHWRWVDILKCRAISVIFGIPDPIGPMAYSLWNFQEAAVTIKGSLLMNLPIIKRFWRNAHAPCHVTQGRGVTNNYIFGIPDPILPIHF